MVYIYSAQLIQDIKDAITDGSLELIAFTKRTIAGQNGIDFGIYSKVNDKDFGIACKGDYFAIMLGSTLTFFPTQETFRNPSNFKPNSPELKALNKIFSTIYPLDELEDQSNVLIFLECMDEVLSQYQSHGCLSSVGNEYSSGHYGDTGHARW